MIRRSLLVLGLFAVACSSASTGGTGGEGGGGGTGGGGGGGTGGVAAPLAYKPCDRASRLGGFSVSLKPNEGSTPFTAIGGGVKNAVDAMEATWHELAKDGDCRLITGKNLVCSQTCPDGQMCAGDNKCAAEPLTQDTGSLTVTGLPVPVSLPFDLSSGGYFYALPATAPYPPVAAETALALKTTGGKLQPFSLAGRGVEPLVFAGTGLKVMRDQPLTVTWTAPAKAGSARIHLGLDIGHHGGIAARIECDVADTGSTTVAAPLVTKLMDQGLAGFPAISLSRQTADSTTTAGGCVDFVVASDQERPVEVPGVVSCNSNSKCEADDTDCKDCPTGMSCVGARCTKEGTP
jgi:hypothetical protein